MFKRLFCTAFGHRYVVERVLNAGARKVGCVRCGKHWGMHDATRSFVPWDSDLEALYAPGGFLDERPCTCHQDDDPPQPCAKMYALEECRALDTRQQTS